MEEGRADKGRSCLEKIGVEKKNGETLKSLNCESDGPSKVKVPGCRTSVSAGHE